MMDRRGFLTTLFGGATAAILMPKIDLAVARKAPVWNHIEAVQWRSTYDEALREAYRIFSDDMASRGLKIRFEHTDYAASLMGQKTYEGVVLTTQRSVMVESTDRERCLIPAMSAMADALVHRGIDRFGTLRLPGGQEFAGMCGPLRMIVQYDMEHEVYRTRFDVLGGSSPHGQRIAQAYRNDGVKRQIRQRLGTYRNPSRLM